MLFYYSLSCCSSPFRGRCFSASQQWRQLSDSSQQRLLLHPAGGGQAVAGHVQQGLQAGGGLHCTAHRTGTNQTELFRSERNAQKHWKLY